MEPDEKDYESLTKKLLEWDRRDDGPRVGDWIIMLDGTERRFTHDWDDCIQTTHPKFGLGSFFIYGPTMSYSGSLDSAIHKNNIALTNEIKQGQCWFFKHDMAGAHRGVYLSVECRVYKQTA